MQATPRRTDFTLSLVVAVLSFAASATGLLHPTLYRDNAFVVAGWFGNDLITLIFAAPLLVGASWSARKASPKARLLQLGMLHYSVYNGAFYLFGAALNAVFLLYVSVFTLSIAALIATATTPDVRVLAAEVPSRFVRWCAGGYLAVWATCLGGLWIVESLRFALTGEVPAILSLVGHPQGDVTNLVAALDLSLLVVPVAVGAAWLLRRSPWGFVLGTVMNVSGATYTLVLTAASLSAARSGIAEAGAQVPLWLTLTMTGGVVSALLLQAARTAPPG
jgi:hypothetical protein